MKRLLLFVMVAMLVCSCSMLPSSLRGWVPFHQSSMNIVFERSGGFAGLIMTATIDSSQLSAEDANHLRQMVESSKFFELPPKIESGSPQPDRFQYQLQVKMDDRSHTVQVGDSAVPESLQPLIEWCMDKARGS